MDVEMKDATATPTATAAPQQQTTDSEPEKVCGL